MTNGEEIFFEIENFKTRRKFVSNGTLKINSPQEKIWNLLMSEKHLEKVHPFCKKHYPSSLNKVQNKDKPIFYSGKVLEREVINITPNKLLHLRVKDPAKKVDQSEIQFILSPIDINKSILKLRIISHSYRKTPRPIWPFISPFYLRKMYLRYHHSFLNGFKYYCETGNTVSRNQFGHIKKLSPK